MALEGPSQTTSRAGGTDFRVDYDAEAGGKVLLNENDVETIVLLQKLNS